MGGVAEPTESLAGVVLPKDVSADMVRALMKGRKQDPDNPEQVQALVNELVGTGEDEPGSKVLMTRTRSDVSARDREASARQAEIEAKPGTSISTGGAGGVGVRKVAEEPGDVYDPHFVGEGDARAPRQGSEAEATSIEAAKNRVIQMTTQEQEDLASKMVAAGMLDATWSMDDLLEVWDKLVDKASRYYDAKVEMTPFDLIEMSRKEMESRGITPGTAATPQRVMDSSVELSNSTQAWDLLRKMLRSELGRNPTDSEVDSYQAALNEAQTRAPVLTDTTSTTDAAGNRTVSATRSGGLDPEAFTQKYIEENHEKEYGSYQAATTYYNALMDAIKRPTG